MADYPAALQEFRRVLRPGGHLLVLDFSMPEGVLADPYRLYLHRVLPRLAGWVTGHPGAYAYLGDSIESFPRGQAMLDLLHQNGYAHARHIPLSLGIAAIYTAEATAE